MEREKLIHMAHATATALQEDIYQRRKAEMQKKNLSVPPKMEQFHKTSFVRGAEFAFNKLTKK